MPGDITGSMVIDGARGELPFREGPVFTNLLLADEINRTPPKTQSALLEAMEEGQVSVDGVTHAAAPAVPGRGDAEPGRVRGHLPAARGPARPVPAQGACCRCPSATTSSRSCAATPPASTRTTSPPSGVTAVAGAADLEAGAASRARGAASPPEVAGYVVDVARATRQSPSLGARCRARAGRSP